MKMLDSLICFIIPSGKSVGNKLFWHFSGHLFSHVVIEYCHIWNIGKRNSTITRFILCNDLNFVGHEKLYIKSLCTYNSCKHLSMTTTRHCLFSLKYEKCMTYLTLNLIQFLLAGYQLFSSCYEDILHPNFQFTFCIIPQ